MIKISENLEFPITSNYFEINKLKYIKEFILLGICKQNNKKFLIENAEEISTEDKYMIIKDKDNKIIIYNFLGKEMKISKESEDSVYFNNNTELIKVSKKDLKINKLIK